MFVMPELHCEGHASTSERQLSVAKTEHENRHVLPVDKTLMHIHANACNVHRCDVLILTCHALNYIVRVAMCKSPSCL